MNALSQYYYDELKGVYDYLKDNEIDEDDYYGLEYALSNDDKARKLTKIIPYWLGYENGKYLIGTSEEEYSFDSFDDLFFNFVLEDGKKFTDENLDIQFVM